MDYAGAIVDGEIAWFELLADSGASSKPFDGGFAIITGLPSNTDNGVVIDPDTTDWASVAEALRWLRSHDLPASCVLRSSATSATAQRLRGLGLVPDGGASVMGGSIIDHERSQHVPAGYEIGEAITIEELRGGLAVLGLEWFDEPERIRRAEILHQVGTGPRSRVRHWIARAENSTVAFASSFLVGDIVVLQHCSVLPEHRRRGLATSLTRKRLSTAAAACARIGVLSPSPDGHRLHSRLGFETAPADDTRWFHVENIPSD